MRLTDNEKINLKGKTFGGKNCEENKKDLEDDPYLPRSAESISKGKTKGKKIREGKKRGASDERMGEGAPLPRGEVIESKISTAPLRNGAGRWKALWKLPGGGGGGGRRAVDPK